jgi:hypothetical protein
MRKREKKNHGFLKQQPIPPIQNVVLATFSPKVVSFSLTGHFLISEGLLHCSRHFEYEACLECG